jgi:Outer membrane protein beta-barrel domain
VKICATLLIALWFCASPLLGRNPIYVGMLGGLATLSGDGTSNVSSASAATSLYDPQNGPAAGIFAGVHLFKYVSLQGNYNWNRNDVKLVSTFANAAGFSFYQQPESITQNALVGNVLVYFRKRGERIRPYLSEGVGVVRVSSRINGTTLSQGNLPLPTASSSSFVAATRTAVGLDVCLKPGWYFRYTFGENISHNPISAQLSPPAQRSLKDFQNLFGIYRTF